MSTNLIINDFEIPVIKELWDWFQLPENKNLTIKNQEDQ